MRVLLVEDDEPTAQAIERMLRSERFEVIWTGQGAEAVGFGTASEYDLILLDPGLPDLSGLKVLQGWRRAKVKTPVIILSAQADVEGKVHGLCLGADDYVEKPFHRDELLARIYAAVRLSEGHARRL